MEPIFELPLSVPPRGSRGRLRALHRQLRTAIIEGRLKPGLRLPPSRAFAAAYGIARNTAIATYDLLLSEGYLVTRRGAGTYIADVLPKLPEPATHTAVSRTEQRLTPYWRGRTPLPTRSQRASVGIEFHIGLPDTSQFPFDVWRSLSNRALRSLARKPTVYIDRQGLPSLREAIAKHVSFTRAVACRPDDILVTAGAQQAFTLLAQTLVSAGKTLVAMEDPGYGLMRVIFEAAGAVIEPVPVDEEGLVVERIPARAKVICVTPSHQFPLGVAMSARRRAALLEFARRRGAVVIEDDYDSEYRYGARPLEALQTLDRGESVFYVGTFSKSLFPDLRLGFVVAPAWAKSALIAAKQCADGSCPSLAQETLAAFIDEGHLARHVRRMRQVYDSRRTLLLSLLERDFDSVLKPLPAVAGLHIAALTRSARADALVSRAEEVGVGLRSLNRFYAGKQRKQGLVFGYGAVSEKDIKTAFTSLKRALVP